jgi:5-aminolevulinate synthase
MSSLIDCGEPHFPRRLTFISGTLGKAYGVFGGYVAGPAHMIDFIRSFGAGFIFTTAIPPTVAAGALAAVQHLRHSQTERAQHQERVAFLKQRLRELQLPMIESESHIVPVMVGDARLCKAASDLLMSRHRIYAQPINYPTVRLSPLSSPSPPFSNDAFCFASTHDSLSLAPRWLQIGR